MSHLKPSEREPYVGRSLPRLNAERFVRGRGSFIADVHLPGERHVAILRSPHPHARIRSIDASEARALPGVEFVLTGEEVLETTDPHRYLWRFAGQKDGETRCLAHPVVRHVGEPVAAVVAADPYIAEDALERIHVEYELLPVLHTVEEALAPDAIRLHAHWDDNIVARSAWQAGDVTAALAQADLVIKEKFTVPRLMACPLEGRGVIASYDPAAPALTVWTSTQSIHQIRQGLGETLRLPEHRIRVICPDVGGAFGSKACLGLEEVLVAYLAMQMRQPVRWIEDRRESFVATVHARAQTVEIEMGFRSDGMMMGLRARTVLDNGAAPSPTATGSCWATGALLCGPYRIRDIEIEALGVVTNKTPIGAYRGFGQPEAAFPLERMVDIAATRLGIDPVEMRRRNLVRTEEMPYQTATGLFLDSGDYAELLNLTLQQLDYERVKREVAEAQSQGRRLGLGLAFYIEVTNFGPSGLIRLLGVQGSGFDTSTVRVEPSGHVCLLTGQTPMGQGVETVLAQACADELGVPLNHVSVAYGDTLSSPYTGYASGGSRAAGVAGSSVVLTARRVREKMRQIAAHLLRVEGHEVELTPGGFHVRGKPERQVTFAEVAKTGYTIVDLPEGMEPGLEATYAYDPPSFAIGYGVIAVVVEVAADTGIVSVRRVVFGHDCGKQLNPAIVQGQILGGVAQGIGAALYEAIEYDSDGQPLVRTLADYLLPTATEVPDVEFVHTETPPPVSVNGAKGAGESGIIAMPAAIVNAIQNALGPDAPPITTTPVWPETILDALLTESGASGAHARPESSSRR